MEKQQIDRLCDKRIYEKSVVLFRLIEAHLVHVIPTAKPFLLGPGRKLFETTSGVLVEPDHAIEETLKGDGRENRLIQLVMHEPLVVQAHELLRERRSTPRRRHDED